MCTVAVGTDNILKQLALQFCPLHEVIYIVMTWAEDVIMNMDIFIVVAKLTVETIAPTAFSCVLNVIKPLKFFSATFLCLYLQTIIIVFKD